MTLLCGDAMRTDLAASGTRMEISIRNLISNFASHAFNPDLTLQFRPEKDQCGLRVFQQGAVPCCSHN